MRRKELNPTNPRSMDPRTEAAIVRGEIVREKLATVEGGSISIAQTARQLGVSKTTVLRRWRHHRLIAWKLGRSVRVPTWQFVGRSTLKGIEEVLQIFKSNDQWRVMLYFLGNRSALAHRRPLDLLRRGKVTEVVAHAKAHAEDNTW